MKVTYYEKLGRPYWAPCVAVPTEGLIIIKVTGIKIRGNLHVCTVPQ